MQKSQKTRKFLRIFTIIAVMLSFLPLPATIIPTVKTAEAAASNLIFDGSFNKDINKSWFFWSGENSNRKYVLARSYEAPFGFGPYSLSITATGANPSMYDAGITSLDTNRFEVSADKSYILSFYIKASTPTTVNLHLESGETYAAVTDTQAINATTSWTKQQLILTPKSNGLVSLVFAVGSLNDGSTLYLDNLNLFENDANLKTIKIAGYIGSSKSIVINNGNLFSLEDLKIELPYIDAQTGTVGTKKFSPNSKKSSTIYFEMPEQTFSGIGKIYAANNEIGQFNYEVLLKLKEVSPNPVLVDEDLVIYGTGFHPEKEKNFIVLKAMNEQGKIVEKWIQPYMVDNKLSYIVVKLPLGVTNGQLSARSYYNNPEGAGVELKSNTVSYAIKPIIYSLAWSKPGYEQIGDKITITGKGIINSPTVYFYDETGKLISSARATVLPITANSANETIEVVTPRQLNKLQVTVKVGSYESDKADALNYTARPILKSIQASKSRRLSENNAQIVATKTGDTIKLIGQGFKGSESTYVEFAGLNNQVIRAYVPLEKIDVNGNYLELVVPKGAQNGQVFVEINGQKSNPIPMEIIPHIISSTPLIPSPGEEMTFWTNGVGLDKELATVHFQLNTKEIVKVKPTSLTESGQGDVIVRVLVPKSISSDSSTIKLQYGNWLNVESYNLETNPQIDRASVDMSTKILIIQGHGFSTVIDNNKINYKFADGTIVNPKATIVSVQNSNEGQEIKIKILDDYYYGSVSVTVGNNTSNEVNIGPAVVTRIERRVQFVAAENRVMGVLYISGRNFGPNGDVKVGNTWAKTHYRSNTFIIAVVEEGQINQNPIIVTKAQ
ncbi:hypothetical protein GW758_01405 [Candidatus Falkowbacteria bacterium]|nr:hypothetical protein [Candidatus Falkowbacteria bacterium]